MIKDAACSAKDGGMISEKARKERRTNKPKRSSKEGKPSRKLGREEQRSLKERKRL